MKIVKIKDLFRIGSSKRVLKSDWKNSGVPFYRGREITRLSKTGEADNELFITESHFKELSEKYGVPVAGDIMVTAIGTIGNTYIVKSQDRFYFKDASVIWLHKLGDVDSQYVNYWLKSELFTNQLDKGNGATVDTLTIEKLSNVLIPLPSLEKQRDIVKKLDSAFAEIDLLEEIHSKSNKELLASLFDTYRDSLLTSACADSPEVEFGEIGSFVRGPFGGSLKKSIFKPSGIAVYEQQHAIYDNFESFRYFIDDIKYQEMKRFEVKTNDLIMSCSGTYGKIAVVPEGSPKGIINQALLKITPDKGVRSQFIKHWMQSSLFQVELEKDIGGAALQNVPSVAKMKSIKIRLPEEKIQIKAIEKLDEVQAEINQAKATQESIKNNYFALRQSLLSSAFTQEDMVA